MSDKSHVGMMNCFFCGEAKGVVLDTKLRNSLPREGCYDKEPCDKCSGLMSKGVMFISVKEERSPDMQNPYRTGKLCVIKDEAVMRMRIHPEELLNDIIKQRICFVPDEVWSALGLPTEGIS